MTSPGSDKGWPPTYAELMEREHAFIRLRLATDQPVELGEFVGTFTAIGAEYDRFVRQRLPGEVPDATLFVKEVRAGSIEVDLIPWLIYGGAIGATLIGAAAAANTLGEFVERYGGRIMTYLKPGGRVEDVTKTELAHITDQLAAIARTPGSSLEVAAIEVEDGEKKVRAAFKFNTSQAREIERRVQEHKLEIEGAMGEPHFRVLMTFTRSDVRTSAIGKKSGELVKIGSISDRNLPIVYASELAEREIKHEIAEAEDNVYKKGFAVDVFVETRNEKPIAYRVTDLHQVIDLPDD